MSNPTPPNGGVRFGKAPDPAASVGISFYHLTATPPERALPRLLEKIVSVGFRVALTAASDERAQQLDQLLWTYDPGSFLPHGREGHGNEEFQPILITSQFSPRLRGELEGGDATRSLLFITDGRKAEGNFERVVDMFDGSDENAVAAARARWAEYKNAGHELTYFKQTPQGSWEKAASNG